MRGPWIAGALALMLGCKPGPSVEPRGHEPTAAREPPPPVDHGANPYDGVWIGPQLQVGFAGPWVLIAPREAGPGARPIELRAGVVRREGDAFALETSVANLYAADFVRPSDWTLLVEHGELALAMGDEPLAPYVASDEPLLVGPVMLAELAVPDRVAPEDVLACLEVASEICVALEAEGPRAAGCREAQWGVCVVHGERGHADPTIRSAIATARTIHQNHVAVRFAEGLRAAASASRAAEAESFLRRTLERADDELTRLQRDGPLPSDDPHLPDLLAALHAAGY